MVFKLLFINTIFYKLLPVYRYFHSALIPCLKITLLFSNNIKILILNLIRIIMNYFLLPTLLCLTLTLNVPTLPREDPLPLMVEYIDQYQIKVNDLKGVLSNQLSNITIGPVKTSYVEVKNYYFSLGYKNGSSTSLYFSVDVV